MSNLPGGLLVREVGTDIVKSTPPTVGTTLDDMERNGAGGGVSSACSSARAEQTAAEPNVSSDFRLLRVGILFRPRESTASLYNAGMVKSSRKASAR